MHRIEASAQDVQKFVARRVPNRADAADLSQQALLLGCAKLDTFRGESVQAWLYAIAQHLIIDYYRARNRFHFVSVDPGTEAEAEVALRSAPDAVLAVYEFRQRLNAWLGCCTRGLHLEHQVAVLLADVYGYHDKDSAARLHMSVPSFKLLLHEARTQLKAIARTDAAPAPKVARTAVTGVQPLGGAVKNVAPPARDVKKTKSARRAYRVGVACPVDPVDLRMLQVSLVDGLTRATLSLALLSPALLEGTSSLLLF